MIQKISLSNRQASLKNDKNLKTNAPKFCGGPIDLAVAGLQLCEQNPMLNVTVLDLSTAIVPRTIIEGQTNPYAGLEALRRESSGLVINCLIPGVVVAGIAGALQGIFLGKGSNMAECWANEDTINLITKYWKEADDSAITEGEKIIFKKGNDAKIYNTIKNILADTVGKDGKKDIAFADFVNGNKFDDSIKEITESIINQKTKSKFLSKDWFEDIKLSREAKTELRKAKAEAKKAGEDFIVDTPYSKIVKQTGVAENIKIKGHINPKTGEVIDEYFSQGLGAVLNNSKKILRELSHDIDPDTFAKKAKKLVFAKSILGLGVIIPLAIAAQPINRWITSKSSGKKGAPIYKDYEHSSSRELSAKEKIELAKQKMISVSSIVGVALLSIMKLPNLGMIKNIIQFKGIFPSVDQARVISTATFASRMMSSEDKNDLREATVRDIATFCSFYFLGDYVAKALATGIQKAKGIELINVLKEVPKDANILTRFGYWAKHTALKSSDELLNNKKAKDLRSLCQLGNIGFSLVALGLIIPNLYRKKTEQERQKELELQKNQLNG